ncbi:hypothetical protein [Kibdelosporangium philippinense]|uniref:hypothetical protein n=1 Tax=Kibdelosporangium philippinense TaxID=211113 RepID=UPI003609C1BE
MSQLLLRVGVLSRIKRVRKTGRRTVGICTYTAPRTNCGSSTRSGPTACGGWLPRT